MRFRMTWTRRVVILALTGFPAALAAQAVTDGLLYDRVHRKLNINKALRIRDLKVEVRDGVVTIEGFVRSQKLKGRAKKVASIKGVKRVNNRLVVGN